MPRFTSTALAQKSGCPPDESADRQAIGRSRGGLTTKLMAMVDKTGRLVRFTIRPGNAAEAPEAAHSPRRRPHRRTHSRQAYDSDPIRLALASGGIVATIPRGSTAASSIGTTRSATWSRTTSATSSSFEPSPPGTTSWRTATAPWSTWPLGSSRPGTATAPWSTWPLGSSRPGEPGAPGAPGERRKSRSISQATNSPRTTFNYPWPWPGWPDS